MITGGTNEQQGEPTACSHVDVLVSLDFDFPVLLPAMAEITMCEPGELYNLLNQRRCVSRLAEINYLCLIDAQETQDYRTGHIVTAKNVKMGADGSCYLPDAVEIDSMQRIVVYDSNTSCLLEQ
ncbi:hypothetical protein ILYODFUR_015060, partial [Ilyodon furcidens]